MKRTTLRATLAALLLYQGACSDDNTTEESDNQLEPGDGSEKSAGEGGDSDEPLYLVYSGIFTPEGSTSLVWLADDFKEDSYALDKAALEVIGGGNVRSDGEALFVTSDEKKTITRYELDGRELEKGDKISFTNRGVSFLGTPILVSEERAFTVNDDQVELIEWNPKDMTITDTHDFGELVRDGWGHEVRRNFVRKSDGMIFFYWTYTNDRTEFINNFVLAVFDTNTNELTIIEEEDCPATAGFGGYFDEEGDLYLFADSFGLFTQFGGFDDPKDSCVLRIKDGEKKLDPDFKFKPFKALDDRHPWGLYYAGDGFAFTTAVDPDKVNDFNTVYELIAAEVHSPWLINISKGTAEELDRLPKTAVGFGAYTVDNRLLIPRTTADVMVEEWDDVQTVVFSLDTKKGEAEDLFPIPGFLSLIERVK